MPKPEPKPKFLSVCHTTLIWLFVNYFQIVWICSVVYPVTNPSPRVAINAAYTREQAYGAWMDTVSMCLFWINLMVSFYLGSTMCSYVQKRMDDREKAKLALGKPDAESEKVAKGKKGPREKESTPAEMVITLLALCLFLWPWASVDLASSMSQQEAWVHRCDDYSVEVALKGLSYCSNETEHSRASLSFWRYGIRAKLLEYEWSFDSTTKNGNLALVERETLPSEIYPLVHQVSYNFVSGEISGTCITGGNTASRQTSPCLQGTVDLGELLSFSLNDTRTNTVSHLRATTEQWRFEDDAPSVMLRKAGADSMEGQVALVTTVTNPYHCNELKACMVMGSGTDMIAPLGVLLHRLDDFGIRCTGQFFGRKAKL